MAHFEAGISVQRTGRYDNSGRALWRLLRDLIFKSAEFGSIVVPEGFVTNYASVPRLPIVYWYCGDRVYEEPALHDYLYTVRHLPRVEADKIFLESLLSNPKIPDGWRALCMQRSACLVTAHGLMKLTSSSRRIFRA